ncbi:hypothetical protein PHLCEN_2v915 [Hermanssonia centrifuga]|uniref:Uncharacterized protein n=1 Tax=Hermanssonia centrifuga TaxID=98765 RepID=A0A2R6S4Q7_9APHY|nr:hypothetical protein PHLCEN_2v915 [Hermanssonia centrifuga]
MPPETPYNIHSSPMRPSGARLPERLSPTAAHEVPSSISIGSSVVPADQPDHLEHMAPKRSQWTSPPPPEASEAERSAFEDRLGQGLYLATVSTDARESEQDTFSSNNSEVFTDEEDQRSIAESDDARSIRSYTESGAYHGRSPVVMHSPQLGSYVHDPSSSRAVPRMQTVQTEGGGVDPKWFSRLRGRPPLKVAQYASEANTPLSSNSKSRNEGFTPPPRMETPRRSMSGPARAMNRFSTSALPTVVTPVSAYPSRAYAIAHQVQPQRSNVFYETAPIRERMSRALGPPYAMPVARLPSFGRVDTLSSGDTGSFEFGNVRPVHLTYNHDGGDSPAGPTPPMSTTPSQANTGYSRLHSHTHSHSQATVTAPTPPPNTAHFASPLHRRSSLSRSRSRSRSIERSSRSPPPSYHQSPHPVFRCVSPYASVSSASGSPPMSSPSSQYASPLSTSPPSPTHGGTLPKHPPKLPPTIPEKDHPPPISSVSPKEELSPLKREAPHIAVVDTGGEEALVTAAESLSIDR